MAGKLVLLLRPLAFCNEPQLSTLIPLSFARSLTPASCVYKHGFSGFVGLYVQKNPNVIAKSSQDSSKDIVSSNEDGVLLGTMKLPLDTDLQRFQTLLFQWANSLCQGANLPLPVPLKVDKIAGGARLGFTTVGDAETEVLVYIDCLVFPATEGTSPIFRAIRNGPLKDTPPPGEPRIMRSLLQALQTSVQIAKLSG